MIAAERMGPEAHIVTDFPDRMERYFSTELFGRFTAENAESKQKPSFRAGTAPARAARP